MTNDPVPVHEDPAAKAAAKSLYQEYERRGLIDNFVITAMVVGHFEGGPAIHVHVRSLDAIRMAQLEIPTEHMGIPVVVTVSGRIRLC